MKPLGPLANITVHRDGRVTINTPIPNKESAMPVASYPMTSRRIVATSTDRSLRTSDGGEMLHTSATRDDRVNFQATPANGRSGYGGTTATLTKAEARRLALNLLVATGDATPGLAATIRSPRSSGPEAVVQRPGGRSATYRLDDETKTAERAVSALHALVATDDYRNTEAERRDKAEAARKERERQAKITNLILDGGGLVSREAATALVDKGYANGPF